MFLAAQREASPELWSVVASAHAARWAHGAGDFPPAGEIDPREARAIAQDYGRIPADCVGTPVGTYHGTLWRAVTDDSAFQRLFGSLFGAALFGVARSGRRAALNQLPTTFSRVVLREFEVLRSRDAGHGTAATGLFELPFTGDFRQDVGAAVAETLGAAYADELATLCHGWASWRFPPIGAARPTGLITSWLSLFEEANG